MIKDKYSLLIIFLLVVPVITIGGLLAYKKGIMLPNQESYQPSYTTSITDEPIEPSNPTNVVIRESAVYDAPVDDNEPIVHFTGIVYWEELAGASLSFFINTSKVISADFRDYETNEPFDLRDSGDCGVGTGRTPTQDCVEDRQDKYVIVPGGRSFIYYIDSKYEPDIVEDTGFIVIFNSQSVDFSLTVDGEETFARVDYYNEIVLPRETGVVSFAPIDEGLKRPAPGKTEEDRWIFQWEYINRQMDSKHDPLLISITYTYDEKYLAFTEQVYQNQVEQQRRQDQINRLNLLNQSFVIIATFAIVASLFSVLFAYLLARRKYQPDLDRAKELPRREAADIEDSESLQVPVRSMFLSLFIIIPFLFSPMIMAPVDAQSLENDRIIWDGTYDLQKDNHLTERISMELPVLREVVYVYANTSETEFNVFDENGITLNYDTEDNRYAIQNPGYRFNYELYRPYDLHNNSNMLVFLDRFWVEFAKPPEIATEQDQYFHVDLEYTLLLPQDAILYSASPSDKIVKIGPTTGGRTNITFVDKDRQMDAFHDVWETQVTFSYIDVIDALENLDSNFVQIRAEQQDLESLIELAATEVLLFSLLGIIAPLISFIIAYWVFRRRYQKMIERTEKEQEERIFIEAPQLEALTAATSPESQDRLYDAYQGHRYRLRNKIEENIGKKLTNLSNSDIMEEIRLVRKDIDINLVMETLSMAESIRPEDTVSYSQLSEFAKMVDEVIEILEE